MQVGLDILRLTGHSQSELVTRSEYITSRAINLTRLYTSFGRKDSLKSRKDYERRDSATLRPVSAS
jgi:hypothetical protein